MNFILKNYRKYIPYNIRVRIQDAKEWLSDRRLYIVLNKKRAAGMKNYTFNNDGLISNHVVPFMDNELFLSSLDSGLSDLGKDIHDAYFRIYMACALAKYALALKGDYVECGVFKGSFSKAICEYIDFGNVDKKFYLFDTFEGIPTDNTMLVEAVKIESTNAHYAESGYYEFVKNKFSMYKNVSVVKGVVPDVLSTVNIENVSMLSIDMNNAVPEVEATKYFYEKLVPGGIILYDDYAYSEKYKAQRVALDELADELGVSIITLPTGQGLLIKS